MPRLLEGTILVVAIVVGGCGGPTDLGSSRFGAGGSEAQFSSPRSSAGNNRAVASFWDIRSLQAARCEKTLCLILNKNHAMDDEASRSLYRWFDWALRSGEPLPAVTVRRSGKALEVKVGNARKDLAVMLATADSTDYAKAAWTTRKIDGKDGAWKAEAPGKSTPNFVLVRDKDGTAVAASVHLPAGK